MVGGALAGRCLLVSGIPSRRNPQPAESLIGTVDRRQPFFSPRERHERRAREIQRS